MKTESLYYEHLNNRGVDLTLLDYWIECNFHRKGVEGFERPTFENCMKVNLEDQALPYATRLKMSRNTGVRIPA